MIGISDINWLYNKYYSDNPELRRIVTIHSELVAKKALEILRSKNLPLNPIEVYCAAMLHDIGVVKCNAPSIYAFGESKYLQHGIEGKKILEKAGLMQYANVCTTHTGAGITAEEIKQNNLPLPIKDFIPKTLLEKLICYADKFFSKSHNLCKEKEIDEVMAQMKNLGSGPYNRFLKLHKQFS